MLRQHARASAIRLRCHAKLLRRQPKQFRGQQAISRFELISSPRDIITRHLLPAYGYRRQRSRAGERHMPDI